MYTPKGAATGRGAAAGVGRGVKERLGVDAQAEVVEPAAHPVDREIEEAPNGADVLGADGDHPPVEVLALHLDHRRVATQEVSLGAVDRLQAGEVDGDLAVLVVPAGPHVGSG